MSLTTTTAQTTVSETLKVEAVADASIYILPNTLRDWPYKHMISPHYRTAQEESVAWLESFHPFTPDAQRAFNKCDFSLFSSLVYPKATLYDLRSCCDLMDTFFVLDEHTDKLDAEATRVYCEASMDGILNPDKPRPEGEPVIGEISRQFWKRASINVPKSTKERFITTWRSYLDSVIVQAQHRDQGRYICTIEEYMDARRGNVGCTPSFAFVEISLGLDIPQNIMEHPFIVQLVEDATDLIMLANDMYSYKKEILVDDADYNAITVLIKNNNTDIAGAIQWIADAHKTLIERFLKVRDDVLNKRGFPSFGEDLDRQILAYIDGLGQFVRGENGWTFASGRYFGDEGLEIQKTRKVSILHPTPLARTRN